VTDDRLPRVPSGFEARYAERHARIVARNAAEAANPSLMWRRIGAQAARDAVFAERQVPVEGMTVFREAFDAALPEARARDPLQRQPRGNARRFRKLAEMEQLIEDFAAGGVELMPVDEPDEAARMVAEVPPPGAPHVMWRAIRVPFERRRARSAGRHRTRRRRRGCARRVAYTWRPVGHKPAFRNH
jgi:hypothetical protein